ncbi:MDR family MFS transporter [Allorhizobium taibaishanense]|uniref:EmrB/QacA subfamily drug resistance transporter n=1 Tax=Allorhizobium taibaishanense TaxID=887144 RepID=A0A1Q9AAT6_9HYPH|nr:MDR family MFS transporter [Allorhizobium taibaishanense]MBB4007158.1 EmrB/QacA subfamily drug resistance transporter [Allorhizobium taibaishanense]OLP51941.1 MFS transporter [Allorhizobium taibaishanense]
MDNALSQPASAKAPPQPAPAPAFQSLVPDPRLRMMLFLFLMTALFMATLDNQIVSTALPTIVGEFGQLERFGWVGSAYLLATSAVMPLYGKLGDLFGRKHVMMTAIAIFTFGSVICGMAVSMDTLIAARVLQGLGSGGIMVSIFSVNADLFEPRVRARYQSYSSLVLMASGAVGPTLGGTMSELFGWRSIFLVNLPIGILVLVGLALYLPYRKPQRRPKIDYLGAVLLAGAVTSVVFWADSGQMFGSLVAPESLGVVAIGVICAVIFYQVEKRAAEPMIPVSLLHNGTARLLWVVSLAGGAVGIGSVNYVALYLQTTTGLSPTLAGLLFIAITGGIAIGSISSGRLISSTGRYKIFGAIGAAGSCTVFLIFSQLPIGTPIALIGLLMLMHGISVGIGQQVPVIGVQNAVAQRDVGAATGTVTLTRMGGASIAISVYGAVLSAFMIGGPAIPGVDNIESLTPAAMASLDPATRAAVSATYAHAFSPVFISMAVMIGCGCLAACLLKNVRLPTGGTAKPSAEALAE